MQASRPPASRHHAAATTAADAITTTTTTTTITNTITTITTVTTTAAAITHSATVATALNAAATLRRPPQPTLREDARALAQGSLTKACELYGQSRSQTNVLRYSGAETVRSREVLVLEAEANVTNEQ